MSPKLQGTPGWVGSIPVQEGGAGCLSIASSLPQGLLSSPTRLLLAENVEASETGIAAMFTQKGKCLERRRGELTRY